jgi:hypothetical protein
MPEMGMNPTTRLCATKSSSTSKTTNGINLEIASKFGLCTMTVQENKREKG